MPESQPSVVTPTRNRLLLQTIPDDHPIYGRTESKIILPKGVVSSDPESTILQVKAIGEGVTQFKKDDFVFLSKFSMLAGIAYMGEKYLVVFETDILGKLDYQSITVSEN